MTLHSTNLEKKSMTNLSIRFMDLVRFIFFVCAQTGVEWKEPEGAHHHSCLEYATGHRSFPAVEQCQSKLRWQSSVRLYFRTFRYVLMKNLHHKSVDSSCSTDVL